MATPLKVLIVEDSEDDAALILREVRKGGFEPSFERVDTPEAMVAALAANDWDIVLSDFAMPRFSALRALEIVQDLELDIPFIVISGTIGEETAVAVMRAGAHDYLMKGNLTRLVPAIERELRDAEERAARRKAESELEGAKEQSIAQDRLAVVGELAAGISHDFNNILGTIMLFSELVIRKIDSSDENHEKLTMIIDQARKGATLVSQVMDFSRRSLILRQPTNLVASLRSVNELLARTLSESINLKFQFADERYVIDADTARLQLVFMNLAFNARDAMPEGGELLIECDQIEVEAGQAPFLDMPAGAWIRIKVSDNGMGIPAEVLPHIFDPFFTTKERGEGTGLGLAQVHGIVKQHDGYIDVDSQEGKGTTFIIYLPALPDREVPEIVHTEVSAEPGDGETILIVEDDTALRAASSEILESLNYRVLIAPDGQVGLRIFAENQDEIDLVLTDRVMPSIGGIELYRKLRELEPSIRVVMYTGYPVGVDTRELLEEGSVIWVQKPVTSEVLARSVRKALQARQQEG
jgi:signal transduction histidine kinase